MKLQGSRIMIKESARLTGLTDRVAGCMVVQLGRCTMSAG